MEKKETRTYDYNKKYADKYISKFDLFQVRLPAGSKDTIKEHVAPRGESVNGFILRAITETIQRDNETT